MKHSTRAEFRDYPSEFYSKVKKILVSGNNSNTFSNEHYVIVFENDLEILNLEIRYEYHCSPFNQIEFFGDFIAIGFEEHFYLYNRISDETSQFKMDGYFGYLYGLEHEFLVCSATNMLCFTASGNHKWTCDNLGIDGVIVKETIDEIIYGIGEWDPPGGWRDFKVSLKTGQYILPS